MPKNETKPVTVKEAEKENKFFRAYMELNESKKAVLRADFINEFDYKSFDSFYRKLNDPTVLWLHEKKWLAERFGTTVKDLFN